MSLFFKSVNCQPNDQNFKLYTYHLTTPEKMMIPPPPDHMMIPQNTVIQGPSEKLAKDYCIYSVATHDPAAINPPVIYIGYCRTIDVFTTPDARRNSYYKKLVHPHTFIYITILFIGTKSECNNNAYKIMRKGETIPICNRLGYNTTGMQRTIVCSNGEEYHSQSEAARLLNINQGALSQHLSGSRNAKSVSGFTFWYKDQE